MKLKYKASLFALTAAVLYAVNIPLSKRLLSHVDPVIMAGLLYMGAGLGLLVYQKLEKRMGVTQKRAPLTKKELPFTVVMVVLDIFAPILLMLGISKTNSANVSLLQNFEIVATSVVALVLFQEIISKKLWLAIGLITISGSILSFEGTGAFVWNEGSLLVLGACLCWGFENNCTKKISHKNSMEIVTIKGCFSGIGSLLIGLFSGQRLPNVFWISAVLLLGFVSYGLSIHFYIKAQKDLGAVKTSAFYSVAPFVGVILSMLLLGERPAPSFFLALGIMILSTLLMITDSISLQHMHEHEHAHSHEHTHETITHNHLHAHKHTHLHIHETNADHHNHLHKDLSDHSHLH